MAYKVDPLIQAGSCWGRNDRGVRNHNLSVYRVGEHAHVLDCSFDMTSLVAIVTKGKPGYSAKVKPMTTCEVCHAVRS